MSAVLDRVFFACMLAALLFLGFVAGAAVMRLKVFPYEVMRDAFSAGQTAYRLAVGDPDDDHLWAPALRPQGGVLRYDPARAGDGLTLYTSAHAEAALLVNMNGRTVHEWRLPAAALHETAGGGGGSPPGDAHWRGVYLYPNGDLLAVYEMNDRTPYGYALVKVDADSRIIWKRIDAFHHAVDVGPDGRIYALSQRVLTEAVPGVERIEPPIISDELVVLSPDGEELARVPLLEAVRDSAHAALIELMPLNALGDPIHANSVAPVTPAIARRFPFAEAGQVLVSLREPGALVLVDVERRRAVWATRGPWVQQHDADFLDNGNILLFDNLGNIGPGGRSRVVEIDPRTVGIVWSYAGMADDPLWSEILAMQQRLPNGNTLITEALGGRILEVTRDKTVVWEYVNPVRRVRGGVEKIPSITSAVRVVRDALAPAFVAGLRPTRTASR